MDTPPLTFQKSPGTHFYRLYGAISQTRLCQSESKHSIILAPFQIPTYLCIPLRCTNASHSEEAQYIRKQTLAEPQRAASALAIMKTFQVSCCKTRTYTADKGWRQQREIMTFSRERRIAA